MTDPALTATHAHAVGLDACLDLINTLALADGHPADTLGTPEEAVGFLAGLRLAHEADLRTQAAREGDAWLARVRDARTALRDLWDAQVDGRPPAAHALATLNAVLDHGPRVELRVGPGGTEVSHRHAGDDPTAEALARAATPLVEAIAAGDTERFRICANDGCRWVFVDASHAGRRRWCDMATCGNRAKVRRFRARHHDDPDHPDAAAVEPQPDQLLSG